jgi:pimeloyl-ACP methyl ester carboxylesterase
MRVIPELTKTNRVIVPDLPGHGESGLPDGNLDAERVIEWLGELIERTCTVPPILVGHLLGGSIALRYTIENQRRVERLVLVDSFGLSKMRPAPKFALAMVSFVIRPTEWTQKRLFQNCFVDYDGMREQMGELWKPLSDYALDRARSPELKTALRSMMPKFGMPEIPSQQLEGINVPTSLIWGRHDLQVRSRIAEEAAAKFGWPLHVIENAADDPAVEQPGEFLRALRESLTSTTHTNGIDTQQMAVAGGVA